MLTRDEVEHFRRFGFVVRRGLIDGATVSEARQRIEELTERARTVLEDDATYDLEEGHGPETPRIRRLKDPVTREGFFAGLARADVLLDAVADLIGPAIRFHNSKINIKTPGVGSPVEWHQDFAFYPHTNEDLVACGLAFDDCDRENGCVVVIPGSHRGPVLDHHQEGRFVGAVPAGHPAIRDAEPVALEMRAGDVSLHHPRLLHASAPNGSNRIRRMLFVQYAAADAFPIYDLDYLKPLMLRGEHPAVARLTAQELPLPRIDWSRYGSIYRAQAGLADKAFAPAKSSLTSSREVD